MENIFKFNLTDTPGVYYALAYWLSTCFYIAMNPRRIKGLKLVGIELLYLLVMASFMVATDDIYIAFFIPCAIFEVFLIFVAIYACCDIDWKKAAYFCVRAFILGEFAASLEWQLLYYSVLNLRLSFNFIWNAVFFAGSHAVVFGGMLMLEKRYRDENARLKVTGKDLRISMFLGAFVYALSNISYVFQNTPFSSQFPAEIFIIRTLADLGGVGMLFAYHMQLQELNVKLEMDYLQKMLHMQYENYVMSEESIAIVNQKYHDLKHQIEILRNTADAKERTAYLDQMEQEIKAYEARNKTGNKVLDTILTTKSLQCQKQDISLTCIADGSELDFMKPMDISALFGNALDNAIESVKKIPDLDKRLIHLSVARQKNFVRIRVENCYEGEILFENGVPATTKQDKKFHGFGLKSIRRIVEDYNGSLTISTTDGWFELRILLPLEVQVDS